MIKRWIGVAVLMGMIACGSPFLRSGVATWAKANMPAYIQCVEADRNMKPETIAMRLQDLSSLQCLLDEDAKQTATPACACARSSSVAERMRDCDAWAIEIGGGGS